METYLKALIASPLLRDLLCAGFLVFLVDFYLSMLGPVRQAHRRSAARRQPPLLRPVAHRLRASPPGVVGLHALLLLLFPVRTEGHQKAHDSA